MTFTLFALFAAAFFYIFYLWQQMRKQEAVNGCMLNCIEKIYEEIQLLKNEVQDVRQQQSGQE